MWLLNHSSARKFEIPMLKKLGVHEIFMPKIVPDSPAYRSASVDFSEDAALTIPTKDLAYLNSINWYENPTRDAINIANQYFDIVFFIVIEPMILNLLKYFKGTLIWRTYGLEEASTYNGILNEYTNGVGSNLLKLLGSRFVFGQAYKNLCEVEPPYISEQSIYLPLGLPSKTCQKEWAGTNKTVFFVCPDIVINQYYNDVYQKFISNFYDFPYVIGGSQSILPKNEKNVLGFVSLEQHEKNMCELRLMFYHSREPRHLHYHPLEAIQAGMPLVFMSGGILDQMGGIGLPGRCETISEARTKIKRILNDDWDFINHIRESQSIILEAISCSNCEAAWVDGFSKIVHILNKPQQTRPLLTMPKRKKIAVIIPIGYRGGSLRGAKSLAQVIYQGSQQAGETTDVILAHLDDPALYSESIFTDLCSTIQRRPYTWHTLTASEARRAMRYAGYDDWEPERQQYVVPDDQINQLMDCDLWVIISDRIPGALLPIRPVVYMVYDYIQRYVPSIMVNDALFSNAVSKAEKVLVTTAFTQQDAVQYAGLPIEKVKKVPMLAPIFEPPPARESSDTSTYFVWTTNAGAHKNHENAFNALCIYYEQMNGQLLCQITGVNTADLLKNPPERLQDIATQFQRTPLMQLKICFLGELSEMDYQNTLSKAAFNWHAGTIDNGTFSVIEAASLGVPALSSDYPAMREIDQQFSLNLLWMDQSSPQLMAEKLKEMELNYISRRTFLPTRETLLEQHPDKLANQYWEVIRECL